MPLKIDRLQRPYPLGWTITDAGNVLVDTWCTLYNKENNGSIREKTNSVGRIIFNLANFKVKNTTVGYDNGDELQLVVGGVDSQNRIIVRRT